LRPLYIVAVSTHPAFTMASKLVPANPSEVMVIRNVTTNITTLSVPFLRFGRIRIGGRGTIGELPCASTQLCDASHLTSSSSTELWCARRVFTSSSYA
jgi:hypothetical protein